MFKDGHLFIYAKDTVILYNAPVSTVDSFSSGGFNMQYYSEPIHRESDNESWILIEQLKNNIIYVDVPAFSSVFHYQKFHLLINQFSYSNGIILDLRANGGDDPVNCIDLAACFFTETRTMWFQKFKAGAGHNDFSEITPITATGFGFVDKNIPVVVLCGSYTYSAANYFVGIMKYLPNVTVIGVKTGGGGSARINKLMPNGWRLYYPYTPAYDIQMNSLEKGVEPHITIEATAEQLQQNHYLVFETAYNYLINQ
ncbi:MAG: S41 family peptidase [Paludibacter sp.]|nr:S41 family peptidase [Paludibacter sp.]